MHVGGTPWVTTGTPEPAPKPDDPPVDDDADAPKYIMVAQTSETAVIKDPEDVFKTNGLGGTTNVFLLDSTKSRNDAKLRNTPLAEKVELVKESYTGSYKKSEPDSDSNHDFMDWIPLDYADAKTAMFADIVTKRMGMGKDGNGSYELLQYFVYKNSKTKTEYNVPNSGFVVRRELTVDVDNDGKATGAAFVINIEPKAIKDKTSPGIVAGTAVRWTFQFTKTADSKYDIHIKRENKANGEWQELSMPHNNYAYDDDTKRCEGK